MRKYDSYKDSGIEWIGEIPSHWEVKKFGHLFSFSRGLNITKQDLKDEGIPCINYGEIHSQYRFAINPDIHQLKCVEEAYLQTDTKSLLERGDFIFADTSEDIEGSGNFTCLDSDTPTFAGYHTVITRHSNENDYKYLAYWFDSLEFRNQIRTEVYGIKVFSITQAILRNTRLLLPPPEEQTAIAAYFDRKTAEIDQLIADKKHLLELYEEEKNAIINEAVTKGMNHDYEGLEDDLDLENQKEIKPSGKSKKSRFRHSGIEWLGEIPEHWEVKRFKYYFNLITEKVEEDLPKIGLENIESKSGKFIETDTDFAGQGVRFRPKDILFGKLRPYLAKVWLSNFDGQAVGDFYVFRSKQKVNPEFAKYRILDSSFIEITNSSTYGSKMPRVSWEFIADLPIAFPEIQEQQSIVRHIETECARIDAKKAKTEKLIELLTEYRTALISEVVTGKIKVTQ